MIISLEHRHKEPMRQKCRLCNLFVLSVQQPFQAWRFYFCRWLCAWGWVGQWHRVIKSSQHTASTQPCRQTWCGCCTSSEQGQTCPRTISPWPSKLISNNCNYRHKTTACKNCLVWLFIQGRYYHIAKLHVFAVSAVKHWWLNITLQPEAVLDLCLIQ